MRNKFVKKILTLGLVAATALTMIVGCGGKGDSGDKGGDGAVTDEFAGKDSNFTWWIYKTDGEGQFYENYEECAVAQYLNAQYWDVQNGGIGTEETGRKINFSYLVPITGSENENFNTMIGTGEYPELIDLVASSESPQALYENGILMDITEYVEKYMPNYVAYLDANPELKPLVQVKEDDGSIHYYALYELVEGIMEPWQGTGYRRDWVAKYAEPTEYVWDWESDYVKENGHPAVTPLAKAVEEDNMEGWKENDVTSFTYDYNANNELGYEDNIIFPSGTSDPLTISDWEWMFEAFAKAIDERGWANDSTAYCTTVFYQGFMQTGDLVSSFGGGTGQYYVKDGVVSFDGDSDNFKAYLECMNAWYEKGWLDTEFNTRANDMFFNINSAGIAQGKVGLWDSQGSRIGTSIRTTCQNEEDMKDAFVMGAALPINDVYGGEKQMYKEPDALYQASRKGATLGITNKAEDKDLAVLFTFLDWTYTHEGGLTLRNGLSEEQYESVELNPDFYVEQNLKSGYVVETDEEGRTVYKRSMDSSNPAINALNGQRMAVGLNMQNSDEYWIDTGIPELNRAANEQWTKYLNTGSVLDYTGLLNVEESEAYNKVSTAVMDYQNQNVPNVIKGTLSWDDYVKGLDSINPDSAVEYLQKYVDLANTARTTK